MSVTSSSDPSSDPSSSSSSEESSDSDTQSYSSDSSSGDEGEAAMSVGRNEGLGDMQHFSRS